MTRTKNGLPGIYNASPITLPDGSGSALAINANGQLIAASPSGASSNQVQGTAADNAAAVGNPIRTGHVYNSSAQTYASGDIADFQADVNGNSKVTSGTATSAAVPAGAYYIAGRDFAGNLVGFLSGSTGDAQASSAGMMQSMPILYNGTSHDRGRSVINATNSTGTGIAAVGLVAQLDDTSPTTITENQFGNVRMGTSRQLLMDRMSPYPYLATPVTNSSGNQANTSAAATLAGVASKTTYITGFEITASGATAAAVVSVTVTGIISGTMTHTFVAPAGATTAATPLIVQFPVAIPASAANTAIVVTLPALGAGNTNATVVAHGYQL